MLAVFVLFFLFGTGCMRDLRLNGRFIPLDGQAREGVSVVSSQGVSLGCSSDSCRKNQCSPPFTCVDLWRIHECRYTYSYMGLLLLGKKNVSHSAMRIENCLKE